MKKYPLLLVKAPRFQRLFGKELLHIKELSLLKVQLEEREVFYKKKSMEKHRRTRVVDRDPERKLTSIIAWYGLL
jgi:hypothetical protein